MPVFKEICLIASLSSDILGLCSEPSAFIVDLVMVRLPGVLTYSGWSFVGGSSLISLSRVHSSITWVISEAIHYLSG